jgi:hypothetical protein
VFVLVLVLVFVFVLVLVLVLVLGSVLVLGAVRIRPSVSALGMLRCSACIPWQVDPLRAPCSSRSPA